MYKRPLSTSKNAQYHLLSGKCKSKPHHSHPLGWLLSTKQPNGNSPNAHQQVNGYQHVVCTHNGLFSLKSDVLTCAETWIYLQGITLSEIEGQVLYDSTYIGYLEQANSQRQHVGVSGGWGGRGVSVSGAQCLCGERKSSGSGWCDGCTALNVLMPLDSTLKKWPK